MTIREHAKQVIRALARTDYNARVWRDGLTANDADIAGDEYDACRVLNGGNDAYKVWLAAWRENERVALQRTYPTAACLLELWERPWSASALRFASHRLAVVDAAGLPPIVDSL